MTSNVSNIKGLRFSVAPNDGLDLLALPCLLPPWRSAAPERLSTSDDHHQRMSVSVVARNVWGVTLPAGSASPTALLKPSSPMQPIEWIAVAATRDGSAWWIPFAEKQADLWAPGPWPASVHIRDRDRRSAWQSWPKSGRWVRDLGDTIRRPS
jgi:hypothetical protein